MANTRTFSRSFSGGELSPEMFGRIDDAKYQTGAAVMQNFIATPQGPARNRAGLAYVSNTKNNGQARLIPFVYNNTQTMVLEFGNLYIRFHTMGETLEYEATQRPFIPVSGVSFTVSSPTVVTWADHTLQTGDSVQFDVYAESTLPAGILHRSTYSVVVIDQNTFRIVDSTGALANATAAGTGSFFGAFVYELGDIATLGGVSYYYRANDPSPFQVEGPPAPDWSALPADLTYEIPSPYLAADLFDIDFVQSADVMTLVHPNYAPAELRRLGASQWTLSSVSFGAVVSTPTGVAVSASPGYLAQISSISEVAATGSQPAHSLFQTVSAHTLSLGDGIYITGLKNSAGTDLSNFYLVAGVPVDGSGNLITNQLWVMDYSGNTLAGLYPGYTLDPGTIQYGTKIFNITSVYAVAALDSLGVNQSLLSATASVLNNLDVPGSYNTITWSPVAGSMLYYVFKQKNGLWGFIGQAMGTSFTDNNIAPDFSITPTNLTNPFSGAGNYPAAVGYIEQRRCFAGTNNAPQTIQMSNSGTDSTFAYSLPAQDTDRISVKIAALEVSRIQHIVPLTQLLLLTGSCEYAEYTTNDGPITPSSIGIRPQSYIGSSGVKPTVVNNSLVYCAARGGHVREMGYNIGVDGYITGDLSLRAAHLFDLLTIVDQAFSKAPLPIVWFVSSNGNLLGLTYVPEQQIGAWHHHVTAGSFESVCCVSEGNEDRLYAVVNRTINGQTVRFVERMASRFVTDLPDCFFVDAGATFNNGEPVTTISGLTWLEGATVAVLADGCVQSQKVVEAGAITLDEAATVVQIGLPYVCDLQTLPMSLQVDGFGQGRQKNLNKAWIRVFQSSGILAGPDADSLVAFKQGSMEYGAPPALVTDEADIVLTPQWNNNGQVLIRQTNPLPLTVVDVTLEVSVGG